MPKKKQSEEVEEKCDTCKYDYYKDCPATAFTVSDAPHKIIGCNLEELKSHETQEEKAE